MTNKPMLSVERELLEDFLNYPDNGGWHDGVWITHKEKLRALLDKPVCTKCGNPTVCGKMICEDCCYEMPAAKHQGEPVAYADPKAFENFGSLAHIGGLYAHEWMWAEQKPGMVALYAEQHAPVAVVMPERMKFSAKASDYAWAHGDGWNACIEEVAKLNGLKT